MKKSDNYKKTGSRKKLIYSLTIVACLLMIVFSICYLEVGVGKITGTGYPKLLARIIPDVNKNTARVTKKELKITKKIMGNKKSNDEAEVYIEKNYNTEFTLTNTTGKTYYAKWMAYKTFDTVSANLTNSDEECIVLNKTKKFRPGLNVSKAYPNRAGIFRIYKNKNDCSNDKGNNNAKYLKQSIVKYSLTDIKNKVDIVYKLPGKPNSKGVVLFDSLGEKNVGYTLINSTNEKLYYKWTTYNTHEVRSGNIAYPGKCLAYDKNITGSVSLKLFKDESANRAGLFRIYASESDCKDDKNTTSKHFIKEKRVYYSLNNLDNLLEVTATPSGDSKGINYVSKEKDYTTRFKLLNLTDSTYYYRWFTFKNNYQNSNEISYPGECIAYNNNVIVNGGLGVYNSYPNRLGVLKVYKNKNACDIDDTSTSTKDVVLTKRTYYRLNYVYVDSNGWKKIKYDHTALSKSVGPQKAGKCFSASLAYGVYILSDGKKKKANLDSTSMGTYGAGIDSHLTKSEKYYNFIKKKIDQGIPVSIHVNSSRNQHYILITGYKTGIASGKMNTSHIYGIDPYYNEKFNAAKGVILRTGTAKKLIKSLHKDRRLISWSSRNSWK